MNNSRLENSNHTYLFWHIRCQIVIFPAFIKRTESSDIEFSICIFKPLRVFLPVSEVDDPELWLVLSLDLEYRCNLLLFNCLEPSLVYEQALWRKINLLSAPTSMTELIWGKNFSTVASYSSVSSFPGNRIIRDLW